MNTYIMKAMVLKSIQYYEGQISMQELEQVMVTGKRMSQAIDEIGRGNFNQLPPLTPPPKPKQEQACDTPQTEYVNQAISDKLKEFNDILAEKNQQIQHLYESFNQMRATIDTQVEVINSEMLKIGTMIHSFQNDMYRSFTKSETAD